mmetsp:Transcript_15260/g.28762  ORF Transcript_15260/g.28762 Transcript_15260/m.28762 type:complete len:245 (+) Transcript_15260:2-736(+)
MSERARTVACDLFLELRRQCSTGTGLKECGSSARLNITQSSGRCTFIDATRYQIASFPCEAARAQHRTVASIAHGDARSTHDGHSITNLVEGELQPEVLEGVASHLPVVIHRHVVADLCERRVNQDQLVHAEEAASNPCPQEAENRRLPHTASGLERELEHALLSCQGREPPRDRRGIVGVAARGGAVEEQVAEDDGEDEPGGQRKAHVNGKDFEDLMRVYDVRHQGAADQESGARHHALHATI